nr:hypothetical protein CFP56_00669 [Quercus suber]
MLLALCAPRKSALTPDHHNQCLLQIMVIANMICNEYNRSVPGDIMLRKRTESDSAGLKIAREAICETELFEDVIIELSPSTVRDQPHVAPRLAAVSSYSDSRSKAMEGPDYKLDESCRNLTSVCFLCGFARIPHLNSLGRAAESLLTPAIV